MRRILLPAVLLAAAVLFLVFYDGGKADSTDPVTGGVVESTLATQDTNLSNDLPVAEGPVDAEEELPVSDRESGNRKPERVVTGKVAVSSSCAADEELRVYAWSEELRSRYVQLMSTTGIGESLSDGTTLLGSASVDPNKTYRLEVMTDLDEVYLYVRGRFAYSKQGHLTKLSEQKSEAYLAAVCGAYIEGELIGMGEEDPALVEIELVASSLRTGAVGNESGFEDQRTHPDADGRFTLTAVPVKRSYEVRVEPQELAPDLIDITPLAEGETRTVRLALQPGARISGRVVGPDELPMPDTRVRTRGGRAFMALAGWTTREEQTNENGEFSFVGLPSGEVLVIADREGYLDSGAELLQLREGEERTGLRLVLTDGNSISGTVRWPDGEPVADAFVWVEFDRSALLGADSINSTRGGDGSATTDAEGGFRVTALGHGPFTVSVTHAPSGVRLENWLATETRLSSLMGGADLDEEKAFAWSDQMEGIRPDAPPLEFILTAPEVVAGRVVDDVGAPVEEYELVMVRLEDSALGQIGVDTIRRQVEDPEGRFLAPGITPANWNFTAMADGFSVPDPIAVTIPQADGSDPLLITLEPASTASGMVFTPSGGPASDAQVTVKQSVAGWFSSISEGIKTPTTRSGVAGEFRLEGLRSGVVELIANTEGNATSEPVQITLVPGEETSNVRLVLRLGGTITGVLYDKEGDLTSNATIQVIKPANYTTHLTRTDSEGSFIFEHLEPGSWQVVGLPNLAGALSGSEDDQGGRAAVMKDMQMSFAELEDGGEVHIVLGAPPEDPVTLTGVVRHRGEPVKGATLVLILEGEPNMPKIEVTDAQGWYSARLEKPGDYLFTVQQAFGGAYQEHSQNSFRVTVPKTTEHHLDIDLPGAGIKGRVTTSAGSAAAGVPITLSPTFESGYNPSGNVSSTQISTSEDGSFSIDSVRPGSYFLRAGGLSLGRRMGLAKTDATSFFGQATMTLTIGEDELLEGVNLVVEEGGSMEVRVVDSAGSPVSNASLFIRDESGQPVELFSIVTTDSNGMCKYPGLAEGNYQVSARTIDSASVEGTPVHITAGETEPIELVMGKGTSLRVTVTDGEGTPVAAGLRVIDSGGREHAVYQSLQGMMARMGTDGYSRSSQVIGPLPPDRYRIYATAEDGRETDKPVNLRGQEERTIRLRFR